MWCVCVVLLLAVWAVFAQTVRHDFVNFDDDVYVYNNRHVTAPLTPAGMVAAFTRIHSVNEWNPLTTVSLMLDHRLFGLWAGGYHLTNLLLHAATVLLLFLLFRAMTTSIWRSAFVAVVFAIHPLQVESVAWVTERKDVLSGLFFMLTLGAYVRYTRRGLAPGDCLLALALFALGLLAKPMLVTLPFLLLLLDYWPLKRLESERWDRRTVLKARSLVVEKIPFFALSAASCWMTLYSEKQAIVGTFSLSQRAGFAAVNYVSYIGQFLFPARLAVFYPHPVHGEPWWKVVPAVLLLALVSAAAAGMHRKRPWFFTGWFWYLGVLFPVSGIVLVGEQVRADRFIYLPQIGLGLLFTWAVAEWSVARPQRRVLLPVVAAAVIVPMGLSASFQAATWGDSELLWNRALAVTSGNVVAHNNLGLTLFQQGRLEEACAHFRAALAIKPNYANACNNLGAALLQIGRADEAAAQCRRALEIKPGYAEAHNNLGNALLQQQQLDEAILHYRNAAKIQPDFYEVRLNLGAALLRKGEANAAVEQFQQAAEILPLKASIHFALANALIRARRPEEAAAQYQRAIDLEPGYAEAHFNLGVFLWQTGRPDEAMAHWRTTLGLQPRHAGALNALHEAQSGGRATVPLKH